MNSQEYIEVSVKIDPYSDENAEILMAELEEFPFESFSMEQPYLKCYIQKDLYLQQDLKVVLSGLDHYGFTTSFTAALLPATNWNAVWESQFTPIVVDGKCTIKASFHKGLKRTRFNITIDPKMAFGTGHHQTTYMMCRALLANEPEIRDKVVMDMGCGTAILAILAAMRGASPVTGIEIDEFAYTNAIDNVALNGHAEIALINSDASALAGKEADVFIANINRNVITADLPAYAATLRPGAVMILSGFYTADIPVVLAAATPLGLHEISHSEKGDSWACLVLTNA